MNTLAVTRDIGLPEETFGAEDEQVLGGLYLPEHAGCL